MIEVIYEDDFIVALNKKPGEVVFSDKEKSLSDELSKKYSSLRGVGGNRNGAAHRLDKNTSGVVLFAKDKSSLLFLQKQFIERKAKKRYIALVFKKVKKESGEINAPIGRSPKKRTKQSVKDKGREAITSFRVMKRFDNHTLLEVFPHTGRKHQIRCHLAHMGHPVAGDVLYGFKDQQDPPNLERQFLHAASIEIKLPSGELKKIEAPLAEDLKKVIEKL